MVIKNVKLLIAITTGRKIYSKTIDMLASNIDKYGHFNNHKISLLINYDPSFLELPNSTFIYSGKYKTNFFEILYLGPQDIKKYVEMMELYGVDKESIDILLQTKGYGNKRNAIILEALIRGYDAILFWDDDEYPFICTGNEGEVKWLDTDILKAHLQENSDIDITYGLLSGYTTTIPLQIDEYLDRRTAKMFGSALGMGSDVINENTFLNVKDTFQFLNHIPPAKEILKIDGGKWIGGGNITFRTKSVREGKIPPYFVPIDARGEDTILSMSLDKALVYQVPAGDFHDAFLEYSDIANGIFPSSTKILKNMSRKDYVNRFSQAVYGWLAYAPLFIKIKEENSYNFQIEEMISRFKLLDDDLYTELPELKEIYHGRKLSDILIYYSKNTETQYNNLLKSYDSWSNLISKLGT